MSFQPEEFTSSAYDEAIQKYIRWLTGASPDAPQNILEQFTLEQLEEAAKAAIETAKKDNTDATLRTKAVYAQALFRDAKYLGAKRGELLGIGADAKVIELYEGSFLAKSMGA